MILNPKYKCIWYILDNSHRLLLGICYYIFGLFSLLLNIWLVSAFLQSPLLNTIRSHLLILNLCVSCLARIILAGFPFSGTSAIVGRWVFGDSSCQLFGFMKQLLGVFQIIALALIAFERYLVSRRQVKAELPFTFYIFGIIFCWIFALLCSVPPLFKIGSYRCDVSGAACDFDWRMTNKYQILFNVAVIIFAGIIPAFTIFWSFWKANDRNFRERQTYAQKRLTKTMIIVTTGFFILWLPQIIHIFLVITGLAWSPRIFPVPLAVLSPLCTEATALIPVLTYLAYDERIRVALLSMIPPFKESRPFVR